MERDKWSASEESDESSTSESSKERTNKLSSPDFCGVYCSVRLRLHPTGRQPLSAPSDSRSCPCRWKDSYIQEQRRGQHQRRGRGWGWEGV